MFGLRSFCSFGLLGLIDCRHAAEQLGGRRASGKAFICRQLYLLSALHFSFALRTLQLAAIALAPVIGHSHPVG